MIDHGWYIVWMGGMGTEASREGPFERKSDALIHVGAVSAKRSGWIYEAFVGRTAFIGQKAGFLRSGFEWAFPEDETRVRDR